MRSLKSTTASNTVDVRSLIHLYVTTLEARGYRPSVIGAYRAAVEHFVSWAAPDGDHLRVSKAAVRDFLNQHLADCQCLGRLQRGIVTVRSALNHLLAVLGETKLASETKLSAHLDTELQELLRVRKRCVWACACNPHLATAMDWTFPGSSVSQAERHVCRDYRRNKSGTFSLHSVEATDRALHRWLPPPFAVIYGSGLCNMPIK